MMTYRQFSRSGSAYTLYWGAVLLVLLLGATPVTAWAGGRIAPSGTVIHDDVISGGGAAVGTGSHTLWGAVGQTAVGRSFASGAVNHGWPTLDKTLPTVTLSTTADEFLTTATGAITVDIVLSEPVVDLVAAAITTDNAVVSDLTSSDALNYSFTLTPSSEGEFSCVIAADAVHDAAANGNLESNTITRTWDKTPPTVTVTPLVTNDSTPELSGTVDDNVAVAIVTVVVGGQSYTAVVDNGAWTVQVTNALAQGTYDVQATAEDTAGNTAQDATTDELVVDLTPPTVTVDALAANTATPTLTGTVNDNVAVASVTVVVGGDSYTAILNNGTWTVAVTNALAEGVYDVQATATDTAGNVGVDGTTNELLVDVTPPTIDFADPVLEVECAAAVVFPTPITDDNFGPVTVTITDYDGLNINAAEVGDYAVEFTAEDSAGNTASTLLTVEVRDTVPPVVSIPGSNPLYRRFGETLTLPVATALDACDGPLAVSITDFDGLDPGTPELGDYAVVYTSAPDGAGLTGSAILMVHIIEGDPPVITPLGDAEVDLNCGEPYEESGATAEDYLGADISAQVVIGGDIADGEMLPPGVYTVLYDVTDAYGVPADTVSRQVTVLDNCTLQVTAVAPLTRVLPPGGSTTFAVEVSGAVGTVSYQWYRLSGETKTPVGEDLPAYTIDPITEADAGQYLCEASDLVTSVESDIFTLTVASGLPAAGLLGLALASALTALAGAAAARKRQ